MDAPMPTDSNVQQAVPFFAVSNMENSLRFYVDGLGFDIADKWIDEGTVRWCRLQRGGASLMIQDFRRDGGQSWSPNGPLGLGVSVMFFCSDALSLYREFTARGLTPSIPFVGNGMWVTSLRDPDGYSVEFESRTDAPEGTTFDEKATDFAE
jgi:catechol 2,3-dioxygenase-like lactoylglutathione lyase family enzyme